jgi:heme exporter protein B
MQQSLLRGFISHLQRDFRVVARHKLDLLNPLVFFTLAVSLIPLGLGADKKVLALLAPGIVWIMALLASLLSLEAMFRSDYEDGSLEQILISPQPLYFVVLAKMLVHWCVTGLPLTLLSPFLGLLLNLPEEGYSPLILSLLLGTITMTLIGGIGAALTLSARRSGLLLSLIVIPLYIPLLIFGASAVQSAVDFSHYHMQLAVLGAMAALGLLAAPFAIMGALRISQE